LYIKLTLKREDTMKQLKLILIIAITFLMTPCAKALTSGMIIQETITGDMTERDPLNYAIDQQMYTTGGITFTYPTGWFSVPPYVQVSLIQNATHPTNITYTVEVTANSATSTSVTVYQITSGFVSEATNNTFIVQLLAIADPS